MKSTVLATILMFGGAAQAAEPEPAPGWSLAIDGGAMLAERGGDQAFGGAALTRTVGSTYFQLGVMITDGGDSASIANSIPATTYQAKVAGGTTFGPFGLDGYLALGRRQFDGKAFKRKTGQQLVASASGSLFSAGAAVTYDLPVNESLAVSPYLALDYSRISTARAVVGAGGAAIADQTDQRGLTGSGGVGLQYLFGSQASSALGLNAAFVTTSNNAAVNRVVAGLAATRGLGLRDGDGAADSWIELGANATFRLNDKMTLDFAAMRDFGQTGGPSVTLSSGIRVAF